MSITPESHLVVIVVQQPSFFLSGEPIIKCQRLASSAAGIPQPTYSSLSSPELIPLSVAFPILGVPWCIWATYTNVESPEVAAYAAESHEVAALTSAPCMVVVSSDALSVEELSSCPGHL